MPCRIAISGSAGTGKTTLATALAHRLQVPYLEEGFRKRREAGLDPHDLSQTEHRALLMELRENHPAFADLPFIFLSALADQKDVCEGLKLGADDYLTKPLNFEMLRATVQSKLHQMARIQQKHEDVITLDM